MKLPGFLGDKKAKLGASRAPDHLAVGVFGLGTFGRQVTRELVESGVNVLAFDADPEPTQRVSVFNERTIQCDVTNENALETHGAFDITHAIVALGEHFDATVILVYLLRDKGLTNIYVQVNTELEEHAIRVLGAKEVFFPERDQAQTLARRLVTPGLAELFQLGEGTSIVGMAPPTDWEGKSLIELELRRKHGVSVVAVVHPGDARRKERVELPPDPEKPLARDVRLFVAGPTTSIAKLKERSVRDEETAPPPDATPSPTHEKTDDGSAEPATASTKAEKEKTGKG